MFRRELSGGRLLRLAEDADAAELSALIRANFEHLAPWMPWARRDYSLDNALEFIRRAAAQLAGDNGLQVLIIDRGQIIGTAGFHAVSWERRSTSIGYWIAADHQGRGIMTETVCALVDHAFGSWELNRVEIRAAVENARSRAIPERLGFSEEGTLRQVELVRGRFLDHVVYSMLASDWGGAPRGA
ncbi:MAG TPA: GNAT family protein [Thermoleophilaceae bacterium]|nr:GNAT family protein [Thermoleophilaceae bacterium]